MGGRGTVVGIRGRGLVDVGSFARCVEVVGTCRGEEVRGDVAGGELDLMRKGWVYVTLGHVCAVFLYGLSLMVWTITYGRV